MTTHKASRRCPVCSGNTASILHHMRFELPVSSPLPREYDLVACRVCGMVYADSPANQKDYDIYYESFSKYEDVTTGSGGGYTSADQARLEDTASLLERFCKKTDSLIDIGCANGGLLEALSKIGFVELAGVDPSIASIERVQRRGFKGFAQKLSGLDSASVGRHQMAVLSHVLEHVFDIDRTMQALRSILNDDGLLYIEVPDASRYPDRYVVPYYYFDAEHINHFDSHALSNLANRYGFSIVESGEKDISVSAAVNYPATYTILKRLPASTKSEPRFNSLTETSVRRYVALSERDTCLKKIECYAKNGLPVILWGAGSYAQRLFAATELGKCRISAIVDNDVKKQGMNLHGRRIGHPETLRGIEGTILISAAIHAEDIKKEIVAMGLPNQIEVLG